MAAPLPVEVRLSHPRIHLGTLYLEKCPHPGDPLEIESQTYVVLERRHRYQLRINQYHLQAVVLYVQPHPETPDKHWINGQWVIGDTTCRYNAHSALIRCAIHPGGPCSTCSHYQQSPAR